MGGVETHANAPDAMTRNIPILSASLLACVLGLAATCSRAGEAGNPPRPAGLNLSLPPEEPPLNWPGHRDGGEFAVLRADGIPSGAGKHAVQAGDLPYGAGYEARQGWRSRSSGPAVQGGAGRGARRGR